MKKRNLLVLLLAASILPAMAEDDGDADSSYGLIASFDHKVAKGFHVGIDAEARMQNNFHDMERWTLGASMSYRLCKGLKADMGYSFLNSFKYSRLTNAGNTVNAYWSPRHRWYGSLAGSVDAGRWTFSLRERYQITHAPLQYVPKYRADGKRLTDEAEEGDTEQFLRSRLQAKYNIRHCPFTPSASIELHNDLVNTFQLDQVRYVVGGDWKLNKSSSLNFHCRYEQRKDKDNGIVVLIGYNLSF